MLPYPFCNVAKKIDQPWLCVHMLTLNVLVYVPCDLWFILNCILFLPWHIHIPYSFEFVLFVWDICVYCVYACKWLLYISYNDSIKPKWKPKPCVLYHKINSPLSKLMPAHTWCVGKEEVSQPVWMPSRAGKMYCHRDLQHNVSCCVLCPVCTLYVYQDGGRDIKAWFGYNRILNEKKKRKQKNN